MRLVVENAVLEQWKIVSRNLKKWNIELTGLEFVDDIKSRPFKVYKDEVRRVILPNEPGTIFMYSYGKHADDTVNFAGACLQDSQKTTSGDQISVIYSGKEPAIDVELRFVHEYLHAMELPSDNLVQYAQRFLKPFEYFLFNIQKKMGGNPEQKPNWQEKFYLWLFQQRKNGSM